MIVITVFAYICTWAHWFCWEYNCARFIHLDAITVEIYRLNWDIIFRCYANLLLAVLLWDPFSLSPFSCSDIGQYQPELSSWKKWAFICIFCEYCETNIRVIVYMSSVWPPGIGFIVVYLLAGVTYGLALSE